MSTSLLLAADAAAPVAEASEAAAMAAAFLAFSSSRSASRFFSRISTCGVGRMVGGLGVGWLG